MDYDRKEYIHGSKERIKEQYFSAKTDVWIRDLDMVQDTAVEITYLRGSCGVTRCKGESNENIYEKCGM